MQGHQGTLAESSHEDNSGERSPSPSLRLKTSSHHSKAHRLAGGKPGDGGGKRDEEPTHRNGAAANREPDKLNVEQGRKQEEIEMRWAWDKHMAA